jgi:nicotinate-nucleotide adenylyltransferase
MKTKKKKIIGIFGGSFDPPHKGHLKISTASVKLLNLDKLHWIVTKKNPFKKKPFFSLNARIHKSKTITKKNKKIKVSYLDDKIRSTKTIKVVNYLVKKNKNCTFFLIIGSDSLVNFHRWNQWRKIAKFCKIVVFSRKGFDNRAKKSKIFKKLPENRIMFIKNSKIDISSSQLRKYYLK